ncbi:MAG TPA: ABC transporter substrate-binding protein [Candidatus Binatia bacterium]|jgi:putative ABC transport system substrate-binding protein
MDRGLITYFKSKLKSAFRNLKSAILVGSLPFALSLLCALLFAFCVSVEAQQPRKIPLIGILGASSVSDVARTQAIRHALRDLGYIEKQNIAIEERYHEGASERSRRSEVAAELVRLRADVIVAAGGNNVVQAVMDATKTIPIILLGQGTDPVVAGFVKSLARPGGNVTGLSNLSTHLGGKRLELFKEAIPKLSHVAVLYDPSAPGAVRELKEDLPPAARALGLTLQRWEVRDSDGFERVFAALKKYRSGGLFYQAAGRLMRDNEKRTARLALQGRTPSAFLKQSGSGSRWTHVLQCGRIGHLPTVGHLHRQNPEGRQACRSSYTAAN